MPIGEQIKDLRKERGWSQADRATKINGDAGQISRYENGKITPSVEAIVKFAELFDVSVDYLLVEDAPRRPFRQAHDEFGTRLADLDKLSDWPHSTSSTPTNATPSAPSSKAHSCATKHDDSPPAEPRPPSSPPDARNRTRRRLRRAGLEPVAGRRRDHL